MAGPVLSLDPKKAVERSNSEASFLKALRQKKKVSRTKLSKLTQLSPYQVEGLEGRNTQSLLSRAFLCINALGYTIHDVLHLIDSGGKHSAFLKGTLSTPRSETNFAEGVKFLNYLDENGNFFGQLQLEVGKKLGRENFPNGDLVFGIVREGTLVIDMLTKQTVHKKDHFFILPGKSPVDFLNGDSFVRVCVLIFSVRYPH